MSSIRPGMTFSDYLGFASMTLLLIGAVNWGVVAIRYAMGDLLTIEDFAQSIPFQYQLPGNYDGNWTEFINSKNSSYILYELDPVPDLLDLLTAGPDVQMIVYWSVFVSGIFYFLLFIWNSIELRTEEA